MRSAFVACAVAAQLGLGGAATAQSSLLDVPYMTQPAALCGGAAASMVLRYWGDHDVFPRDFAPLVDGSNAGISTAKLDAALRDRGWQTFIVRDDGRDWTEHLAKGRPLIALIAVGRNAYHYVVVVGATADGVIVHDPAVAPFQMMGWDRFDAAWQKAQRWMLLVRLRAIRLTPPRRPGSFSSTRPTRPIPSLPPTRPTHPARRSSTRASRTRGLAGRTRPNAG